MARYPESKYKNIVRVLKQAYERQEQEGKCKKKQRMDGEVEVPPSPMNPNAVIAQQLFKMTTWSSPRFTVILQKHTILQFRETHFKITVLQ